MVDIPGNIASTAIFDGDPNLMATFSGELETFNDKDWIKVTLTGGTTYKFFGSVASGGSAGGDSIMGLLDASGVERASNHNETATTANSFFSFTATTSGTYFVEMSSGKGLPGHYSVAVIASEPHARLTTAANYFSGLGNDLIVGDMGDDTINLNGFVTADALGEQGNDSITGDGNVNLISGGLGNDSIEGNDGDDLLFGDAGEDRIEGGSGDDDIRGGDGADVLLGDSDQDTIHGGDGSDFIQGGTGNDVLDGGLGQDSLLGYLGDDQFVVDDAGDEVSESFGEGNDTVLAASSFTLTAGNSIETLKAQLAASTTALNLTGNEFGQTIIGNNGANFLYGAGGADTLQGLLGNDIYALGNGTDAVADTGGVDTITSTISRSLASYATIERLALVGTGAVNGTGNNLANLLTGNAAANILNGGVGADLLNGGSGNDTLDGGTQNDTLLGLAGNDVLFGNLGKDAMTGGLGNDVFRFTAKSQSVVGANADVIKDFDDFGNDRIDVSGLFGAAMTYRHNLAFTAAGQVRINDIAGADVLVEVNTVGAGGADFAIRLTGTTLASMTAGDFFL
jgi:serralysin